MPVRALAQVIRSLTLTLSLLKFPSKKSWSILDKRQGGRPCSDVLARIRKMKSRSRVRPSATSAQREAWSRSP
jgi:hypothetical protein